MVKEMPRAQEKPVIDQYQKERNNVFFGRPSKPIKSISEISKESEEVDVCSTSRGDSFFSTQPKPKQNMSTVPFDNDYSYRGDENSHLNESQGLGTSVAQYSSSQSSTQQSEYTSRRQDYDDMVPSSQTPNRDKNTDSMNSTISLGNSYDDDSKPSFEKSSSSPSIFRKIVSPFTTSRKFTLESRWSSAVASKRQPLEDARPGSERSVVSYRSQVLESQTEKERLDPSSNFSNDDSSYSQPQQEPQRYPPQQEPQRHPPQHEPQRHPPQLEPQRHPPQQEPQRHPPQQEPQRYPSQQEPQWHPHQQQYSPKQQHRLEPQLGNVDNSTLSERRQQPQAAASLSAAPKVATKLPLFNRDVNLKDKRPSFQKSDVSPHFKR